MATARWLVATARWFCGRQVLLRLRGYISVCPTLQLSHNDVPGVGLGGCWNQVLPSHSHLPAFVSRGKRNGRTRVLIQLWGKDSLYTRWVRGVLAGRLAGHKTMPASSLIHGAP